MILLLQIILRGEVEREVQWIEEKMLSTKGIDQYIRIFFYSDNVVTQVYNIRFFFCHSILRFRGIHLNL